MTLERVARISKRFLISKVLKENGNKIFEMQCSKRNRIITEETCWKVPILTFIVERTVCR